MAAKPCGMPDLWFERARAQESQGASFLEELRRRVGEWPPSSAPGTGAPSARWRDDDVAVGVFALGASLDPGHLIDGVVHGLAVGRAHGLECLLLARGQDLFGDLAR